MDHFPIFLVAETEKRIISEEKVQPYEHEIRYKNFVNFPESIKQRTKSQYYSKMIFHYQDKIK